MERGPYSTEPGPRRRWKDMLLHAEDGLVVIRDEKTGKVEVLFCRTAKDRLKEFTKELRVWDAQTVDPDRKTQTYARVMYREIKGLCEVLSETVRDAVDQGDQNDPEVRRRKLTAFLRAKQAQTGSKLPVDLVFRNLDGGPLVFRMNDN